MLNRAACGNVVWFVATHSYTVSPFTVQAWVHKQHPISPLGALVGGVCRNAALQCFIYDKICLFNFAVVRIWNCDSFFLVGGAKSSGSLTPSTLADVFRCYVLCGLSEFIFYSRPSGTQWNPQIILPPFNQIFFQGVIKCVWIGRLSFIPVATWLTSVFRNRWWKCCSVVDWLSSSPRVAPPSVFPFKLWFAWPLSLRSKGTKCISVWSGALRQCLPRSPLRISKQYQAIIA